MGCVLYIPSGRWAGCRRRPASRPWRPRRPRGTAWRGCPLAGAAQPHAYLPGSAFVFERCGARFALVEEGRHPPSEPSVYHSRGSHAPQILVALRGSPAPCSPLARRRRICPAAHLPDREGRAKMEKELDEEAPQHEDDARRSAPFSPAALLSRGQPPNASRRAPTPTPVPASRAP